MLDVNEDSCSLTEFKARTEQFIAQLRRGNRALLLTVDGRAELAVISAATLQRIREDLDTLDALRGIQEDLEDRKAGRSLPADRSFARLRKKHGLPERGV